MIVRSALIIALATTAAPPARACDLEEGQVRTAIDVVDGDTLLLDDRSELRLVGALRPAPPAAALAEADWPPAAEAKRTLMDMVLGRPLMLQTEGRATDRYGRRQGQAFVLRDGVWEWVQGRMVEEGEARATSFADARTCAAELVALEAAARDAGIGLWANPAYAVREAWKSGALTRDLGSYQIVEGLVKEAVDRKRRIYLDFGTDWREDFSVSIEPRDRHLFEEAGVDLLALTGKRVRVRGWIESASGPTIRLTLPEQLEVLEGAAPGDATPSSAP